MQMYELGTLLSSSHLKNKEGWEQARFISFMTAQVNSSKKLKPTDILKFGWEEEHTDTSISDGDIQRLKEKSKAIANKINK